ncbi:MAG: NUDIX domain-containing protein [archaeon]|nr:NUDIX domain-containing protein [archaeon]
MKEKHGVTAIIYDERDGKRYFLILHRILNWTGWEFLKGGIDKDELPEQALLREIDEESGLSQVKIISNLPQKFNWVAKDTKYVYTPFVLRGNMNEPIDLEQEIIEHDAFKWVEQNEVESFLTHEDNKRIFKEAIEILGRISEKNGKD